jgi:hypothetical protein
MPERVDFWRGFVAGTLAGMAVAAFSQYDLWRKLTTPLAAPAKERLRNDFREHAPEIAMHRETSESAGDPSRLTPARATNSVMPFVRPGGAPGPVDEPEVLDAPGRPGQSIDHSDPARSVTAASRSLNLRGRGV